MAKDRNAYTVPTSPVVEESTETSTVVTEEETATQVEETTPEEVAGTPETEAESTSETTEEETPTETQPEVSTEEETSPEEDESEQTMDTTPEELPEPQQDESEVEPTTAEEVAPTVSLSLAEVRRVIADESIGDMRARLQELAKNGPTVVKLLVMKLLGYADVMGATVVDAKIGAGRNYDLYNTLISILGEEDQALFKLKFDIVNLVFKEYRAEAFHDTKLHRFDKEWPRDATTLNTYQNLVTVITALCDLNERKKQMKTLSLEKAFDITTTAFTAHMISAAKRYYA